MTKALLALTTILLSGCAAFAQPGTSTAAPTLETPSKIIIEDNQSIEISPCGRLILEDWENWAKVNSKPIKGHDAEWADIYVDELAEKTYLSASAPYPECAIVVKTEYTSQTADVVDKFTVMLKMPIGYDPEHGDWWYGAYRSPGGETIFEGKVAFCIACHEKAAETDYMYSREVLQAANE